MAASNQRDHAAIVSAIPMPAMLIGPDQRIDFANQLMIDVFGQDLNGLHFIKAIRRPSQITAIEGVFASKKNATIAFESGRAGVETHFQMHIAPANDAVLITLVDQSLTTMAGQLRTDFIANASHELRTPLTALTGFIETLRGAARDDPTARDRFLGIMDQEAGRMTRLVDELMTLSQLEENERHKPTTQIDLSQLVQSSVATLGPIAAAKGVTLLPDLPKQATKITADAAQMQQVIVNLVENAIKYGADHDTVHIVVSDPCYIGAVQGNGVRLTVTDHGAGIAPHHIARLTERFFRVDNHRSREVGGTGLGLAIVKHIINRHRGRIKIDSTLGQGTTVTVTLPVN